MKAHLNFKITTILVAVVSLGYALYVNSRMIDAYSKLALSEAKAASLADKESADLLLGQYAINMMHHTPAGLSLSDARKQTLARSIVRVSSDVFDHVEDRKAFIAVIAIESGFQRNAQSPTGPRGLSQVAKKAFKEGLDNCGIPSANDEDVWDTDINLYAGACYFRALLERNGNDPFIAIVAYNKGPNSESIKTYSKSGKLDDVEALKYVAKFNFLKRTVPEGKVPDIPAFEGPNKVKQDVGSIKHQSEKKVDDSQAKAGNKE